MKKRCESDGRGSRVDSFLHGSRCIRSPNVRTLLIGMVVCGAIVGPVAATRLATGDEETPRSPKPQTAESASAVQATAAELKKEQIEVADSLLKRFPNDPSVMVLMGEVHRDQGNSALAVKYWRRALKLAPNRPDIYQKLASNAMQRGELAKAVMLLRKLLQLDPARPNVRIGLAGTLMDQGKTKEAITELEKEVEISPEIDLGYYMLGRAYLQLKEYQKAKENYETAIKIQPKNAAAYYGLATVYARLGQRERSKECLQTSRELTPQDLKEFLDDQKGVIDDLESVRQALAGTCTTAGGIWNEHGYAWRAEKHWRRAVALAPKDAVCRVQLVLLYERSGRESQALRLYDQLTEIAPQSLIYHLKKGLLNRKLERFEDAERSFQDLIRHLGNQAAGYHVLAELYLDTNQKLSEAKTLAAKAVQLEPAAPQYSVLARACERTGDVPGALSAIQRAIELDPDSATYREMQQRIQKRK